MAATKGGFPEILRAAADGNLKALKAALKKMSPDTANGIGQAPLHLAAMWGHLDAVDLLIKAGADVNIANDYGITPLHYAAEKNQYDIAKMLLENGANKRVKSRMSNLYPWESAKDDRMRILLGAPTLDLHRAVANADTCLLEPVQHARDRGPGSVSSS